MKATINLEFTDQELVGFVERWANKLVVNALGDLGKQIGPLVPLFREAFMRTVAAETARGPAPSPSPFPTEGGPAPTCDGCEEELRTHCAPVSAPNVMPGWACHECRAYNGLQRTQCKACGHTRCGPAFPQPPVVELDALCVAYDGFLIHHPAKSMYVTVRSMTANTTLAEQNIGFVRSGAALKEAIMALHDRSRETTYEVTILDRTTGERRINGRVTMPDTESPPADPESTPAHHPPFGG